MKTYGFLILLLWFPSSPALISQEKSITVASSETWMNNQHQPEKLMDAIGLKERMTIADIGEGRGRMTVWFADRVGDKGEYRSASKGQHLLFNSEKVNI
jgi:predicted methyltransferase